MEKTIIGRAINGIGLNGLEYLLNEDGTEMEFDNQEVAEEFLVEAGIPEDEIEYYHFKTK
jgi:hypothetical protein